MFKAFILDPICISRLRPKWNTAKTRLANSKMFEMASCWMLVNMSFTCCTVLTRLVEISITRASNSLSVGRYLCL